MQSNLLDEALGPILLVSNLQKDKDRDDNRKGRVVLIEDCVETSGGFVLNHLIKRYLSLNHSVSSIIFISLSHSFSHYDRILRKLGCNLTMMKENKRFFFLDMLKLECSDGDGTHVAEGGFVDLYGKILEAIEIIALAKGDRSCITLMIDDISVLEIAAHGSANHVLDFLHYCHTLMSEMGCSLVMLNHEDIYSSMVTPGLTLPIEYLADVIIKAEPLATGLASDVHGQLTVVNKCILTEHGHSSNWIRNFHFRVKDNCVEYFYPGTRA